MLKKKSPHTNTFSIQSILCFISLVVIVFIYLFIYSLVKRVFLTDTGAHLVSTSFLVDVYRKFFLALQNVKLDLFFFTRTISIFCAFFFPSYHAHIYSVRSGTLKNNEFAFIPSIYFRTQWTSGILERVCECARVSAHLII